MYAQEHARCEMQLPSMNLARYTVVRDEARIAEDFVI